MYSSPPSHNGGTDLTFKEEGSIFRHMTSLVYAFSNLKVVYLIGGQC